MDGFEQLPPQSIDAEISLLGALILGPKQIDQLSLTRADFAFADHGMIFDLLRAMHEAGTAIDALTLKHELQRLGRLDDVGHGSERGMAFIAKLIHAVPSATHAASYVRIVTDNAKLRRAMSVAHDLLRSIYDPSGLSANDIIQSATAKLVREVQHGSHAEIVSLKDAAIAAYEGITAPAPTMITTGFPTLDSMIGGIELGEVCVVGARPSMGKSSFIKQTLAQVAARGIPVALISLEEQPQKIGRNLLSNEVSIPNYQLRNRQPALSESQIHSLADGVNRLAKLPFYISRRACKISEIENVAHVLAARHGVKLFAVDHLSRVRVPGARTMYESVTTASGVLSDLAKSLGAGFLLASQLNRDVESRDEPVPTLSDLRESGAVEQDADTVILLYRPDYYNRHNPSYEPTRTAELIIAKCRDGCAGETVKLQTDLEHLRFIDTGEVCPI